jgi:hypothetical protein
MEQYKAKRRVSGHAVNMFPKGRLFAALGLAVRSHVSGHLRIRPVPAATVLHDAREPYQETSCCVFSHYDPMPVVDMTVFRYLEAIKDAGYAVVFISTAPALAKEDIERLRILCSGILHRDNEGLDFASWKSALDAFPGIKDARELLFANDSIYLRPDGLIRVFSTMDAVDCDFWGLTESREKHSHLQSYFLVFRKRALTHPAFGRFWDTVGILPRKKDVIDRCETVLTPTLALEGLTAAAYVPAFCEGNPTLAYPEELVRRFSLPMLKRACLRDNPLRVPLHDWDGHFTPEDAGYVREHMARLGVTLPEAPLPEVSILLPAYNGSQFLEPLMDSCLAVPDVRLIARDDHSEDATLSLLKRYGQEHGDRMEVHAGERLGVQGNVSWLLSRCRTPYFLLADQDDVWDPRKLPALWEAMQRLELLHGKDVPLLVYSDASLIDEKGDLLAPSFFDATGTPPLWGESFRNTLVFSPAPGCTMMGNSALIQSALPIPDGVFMHDWWLLLVAGALGGVRVVNAPLVKYRQHTRNMLGARPWNARSLLMKAVVGPKRSRMLIRKTQYQARLLLERHGSVMPKRNRRECLAWAAMSEQHWPQRVLNLIRYSFTKPGKLRNALFYLCN